MNIMTNNDPSVDKILNYSESYYTYVNKAIQAEKSNDFNEAIQCYIKGLEFSNRCLQEQINGCSPIQIKTRDIQNELKSNRQSAIERLEILYSYLEVYRSGVENKNNIKIDSNPNDRRDNGSRKNSKVAIEIESPKDTYSDKLAEQAQSLELHSIETNTKLESSPSTDKHTLPISPRPQPSGFAPTQRPTSEIKDNEPIQLQNPSVKESINVAPISKSLSKSPRPQPSRILLESETKPMEDAKTTIDKDSILKILKNIDPISVEIILSDIIHNKLNKFDDIVGNESAKQYLLETVIYPKLRPDLFTGLRTPAKGILLFGPPGNGKTLLAKAVANKSKSVFFNISAASLMSKWVKVGEKIIQALFAVADHVSPSVIFLDEIELLLYARDSDDKSVTLRIFTQLLKEIDEVSNSNSCHITIIAASERPFDLDDAALRRFQKKIYIKIPEARSRKHLLDKLLDKQTTKLKDSEIYKLVELTDGFSFNDLENLAKTAVMVPIKEITSRNTLFMFADDVRPTEYSDFVWALKKVKPAVTSLALRRFDNWDSQFGDDF